MATAKVISRSRRRSASWPPRMVPATLPSANTASGMASLDQGQVIGRLQEGGEIDRRQAVADALGDAGAEQAQHARRQRRRAARAAPPPRMWPAVPRPTVANRLRLASRGKAADANQPAAPADQRAHRGGHRHADQQGERLAAHHPAQRTAALAVGHAAGDLGEDHADEGAAAAAADRGPHGDPEEGAGQRLRQHGRAPARTSATTSSGRRPTTIGQPAAERRGDAPRHRRQRHQVGDQRHADIEVVRHVEQEGRARGAARGGGERAEAGRADQGPRQGSRQATESLMRHPPAVPTCARSSRSRGSIAA